MKLRTMLVSIAAIAASVPALAHDLEKGPHGGPLVDVSGHHVEFTSANTDVTIYLTENKDAPIASAGATGQAVVQQEGKASTIALTPAEPNLLKGKLEAPIKPGAKVVVTGKLSDGHSILARFEMK